MASVGAQGRDSLEQQLAKLKQYDVDVPTYKPNIDELKHLNQEVQGAMIFENRHTSYTMEVRMKLWCKTIRSLHFNMRSRSFQFSRRAQLKANLINFTGDAVFLLLMFEYPWKISNILCLVDIVSCSMSCIWDDLLTLWFCYRQWELVGSNC